VHRQDEVDRRLAEFVDMERAAQLALRRGGGRQTTVAAELRDFMRLSTLRRRLRLVVAEKADDGRIELAAEVALFRQVLSEARANVESWGGSLYFVYLPDWARYDRSRSGPQRRAADAQRERVLVLARDLGLPIIDVVPAFDAQPDAMALFPFHAPGHYTEEGHRLVARVLAEHIPPRIPRRMPQD
jgi:acetyltransferase AlgX (SGNH hydrolase-like protein)